MKKMIALSLLVLAPLSVPAVASAQDAYADTHVRNLESASQVAPRDGGTMIELAQAYANANRGADALTAYARALKLDNMMLVTKTGDNVWSHQIAKRALAHGPELSSR
ncbi:tetratricopeptide repeat protein [Sphingomonas immobilis]|uniref:Tetratricopeptide repeat protein n=1 Tax=Sphingomonas immobilis TaxID=3063997 RepID=A0ABT9A055_9SPHN|nr:hypothetical protein [Sphingomonas sp. CA1-15]MDO7842376.1 hypothetical protein [Sphingomonas sp. CA1-15]